MTYQALSCNKFSPQKMKNNDLYDHILDTTIQRATWEEDQDWIKLIWPDCHSEEHVHEQNIHLFNIPFDTNALIPL